MAVSEKDVYGEIRKGTKPLHGICLKVSDRFGVGYSDLALTIPSFGTFWCEVKFATMPKMTKTAIKVELTEKQRIFIREQIAAGGKAGWLLCVKVTPRLWYYWVSTDPDVTHVEQGTHDFVRKTGELTNTGRIAEVIVRNNREYKFGRHGPTTEPKADKNPARHARQPDTDRPGQGREEEAPDRPVVRRGSTSRFGT